MRNFKDFCKAQAMNIIKSCSDSTEPTNYIFDSLRVDDVVVVTGGYSGLGRLICKELIQRGIQRVVSLDVVVPTDYSFDASAEDISEKEEAPIVNENNSSTLSEPNDLDVNKTSLKENITRLNEEIIEEEILEVEPRFSFIKNCKSVRSIESSSIYTTSPKSESPDKKDANDSLPIDGVEYILCDISKIEQVRKALKHIATTTSGSQKLSSPVTVLINNAGVMRGNSILKISNEDVLLSINVNLLGNFNTIRAVLPGMMQKKRGFIVTISSVLGHLSPAQLSIFFNTVKQKKAFFMIVTN